MFEGKDLQMGFKARTYQDFEHTYEAITRLSRTLSLSLFRNKRIWISIVRFFFQGDNSPYFTFFSFCCFICFFFVDFSVHLDLIYFYIHSFLRTWRVESVCLFHPHKQDKNQNHPHGGDVHSQLISQKHCRALLRKHESPHIR